MQIASAVSQLSSSCIEPNEDFRPKFNRVPFPFSHHLENHPLFELPRLLQLARSTREKRPGDLYYDAGDIQIGQRWDQTGPKPFPVEEALDRIEHAGAWIILSRAERDPEYGELLNRCMGEIETLIGVDLKKVMKYQDAIIFVSSPNRITSYHIDRECNFLLQIRGNKTIYVFDQNDREVLPEVEIERFWTVDHNAAQYRPQFQDRAHAFRFRPGVGVHIPVNAPHWVKNDDNVSISLSVNFVFRDSYRANIYRANHALRRLGLKPSPPGQSPVSDAIKRSGVGAAIAIRNSFRRRETAQS